MTLSRDANTRRHTFGRARLPLSPRPSPVDCRNTSHAVAGLHAHKVVMNREVQFARSKGLAADPGPRPTTGSEGGHLANMSSNEIAFFSDGQATFAATESLSDGLGPRFNLDSCGGCHIQPALGGTAPTTNPQVAVATAFGMRNTLPSFITANGPVREARFRRTPAGTADGGQQTVTRHRGQSQHQRQ